MISLISSLVMALLGERYMEQTVYDLLECSLTATASKVVLIRILV